MNQRIQTSGLFCWTRFVIWYRNHLRPVLDEYRYPLLALVWVMVFILGYIGLSQVYPTETFPNLIFYTMQLFVMNSGTYQGPPDLVLNIARVLAPLLLYLSILAFVAHRFYYHIELFRLRLFARDHIIICGLGYVGSIVLRNSLSTGSAPIVAIEKDPDHNEVLWCKRHGIPVVIGDATDTKTLERARISTAHSLYVVTGSDEINAKVIAQATAFTKDRKTPLKCHVHIIDPNFTNLLHTLQHSIRGKAGLEIKFLNIYQIASFWYVEKLPDLLPVSAGATGIHVLIVGVGRMGESLIFELAKRSQQQYFGGKPHQRIRISIVDRDAARKKALLENRYAHLSDYCELIPYTLEINSSEFYEANYLDSSNGSHSLSAAFIVTADESLNFSTGLFLNQKLKDSSIPVIIRTVQEKGFAHFFNELTGKDTGDYKNLRAFPLVSFSSFIDSSADLDELIARTLHRNYQIMRFNEDGAQPGSEPSLMPWDKLDENFKDANRDQARCIKRAVEREGYTLISRVTWDDPLTVFSADEIERMAIMEHQRWWDNRKKNGWTYGPKKDVPGKISPYMVPWEDLTEDIRDYDRKFVKIYPRILAMVALTLKKISAGIKEGK
jgi:hypothetical protein